MLKIIIASLFMCYIAFAQEMQMIPFEQVRWDNNNKIYVDKDTNKPINGTIRYGDKTSFKAIPCKNGKIDGVEKGYRNKKLKNTTEYKNGKKHGVAYNYDKHGEIKSREWYKNGKLIKEIAYYDYKKKKIRRKVLVKKGVHYYISYYPNGNIFIKRRTKNDHLIGKNIAYYRDGKKMAIIIRTEKGKYKGALFDKNGNKIRLIKRDIMEMKFGGISSGYVNYRFEQASKK